MLFSRNKTKTSAVAFIALLTLSAVVAVLPAFASLPTNTAMPDRATATAIGVSPTLVGLGQSVLINILTYPAPSGPTYYAQDLAVQLKGGLRNVSCTITKPDGTKDTFMPIDETLAQIGIEIPGLAQIVGSLQFRYEPDQVGNYSVTGSFGGTTYTTDNQYASLHLTVLYKPSSSRQATTFTVQDELVLAGQLNGWPWSPLPTAYWADPVQTDNREWTDISGDWIQGSGIPNIQNGYNHYSTAPNSPHILWVNEIGQGGLPGGVWGSQPYGGQGGTPMGGAGSIVLDGKIYQSSALQSGYFDCVDLRTGQKLWSAPGAVTMAQRLDPGFMAGQTLAQQNEGGIAVHIWKLSGTEWVRYNPFNGVVLQTITGAPTNVQTIAGNDGDPIFWVTQSPGGEFLTPGTNPGFNTSRPMQLSYANLIKWDYTKVKNNNWATGIVFNVSVIEQNEVGPGDNGFFGFRAYPFPEAGVTMVRAHNDMQYMAGYDYNTGAKLWKNNATVIDIGVGRETFGPNGPFIVHDGATPNFVAYNMKTGQEEWRGSLGELPWSMLPGFANVLNLEKGVFYSGSYDGRVYAYDYQTGDLVWQSDFYGEEFESVYNTQPYNGAGVGADGKLYFSTATTYSLMPRTRFHALVAIDEATGHYLWKLPIGISPSAVADGYLIGTDSENGIQYGIGKGKTSTTVVASPKVAASGSGVLIEGSVMDLSPGAPNTAAVSDADMSEWMDYLYGQNATLLNSPPTPHGVSVQLTALGSDGSAIDLGTVTSDESGMFKKMWKPTAEGEYTVYATFAGSDSYWSSYAETALGVVAATETGQQQPTTQTIDNTPLIAATAAIIIAIAIVGVLMLRRGKQ